MAKKAHHRTATRYALTGLSALGVLAVSTQVASANQVVVKAGDTVWKIAQQHGLTVKSIEDTNPGTIKKISNSVDLIYAGQKLTLSTTEQSQQTTTATGMHIVAPGETLSQIADHYQVSVSDLMNWNHLASDQVYVGQELQVNGPVQETVPSSVTIDTTSQVVPSATAAAQDPAVSSAADSTVDASTVNQESTSVQPAVQSVAVSQSLAATSQEVASQVVTTPVSQATSAAMPASTANSVNANQQSQFSDTTKVMVAAVTNTQAGPQTQVTSATSTQAAETVTQSSATPAASANQQATTVASTSPSQVTSQAVTPQLVASQVVQSQSVATSQQVTSTTTTSAQSSAAVVSQTPASSASTSSNLQNGSVVSLAVKIANSNSVPYVWGGSSLNGMDCSGLVDYVYANAENKQLPHNTVALESVVDQHSVSEAQAGDILFWGNHGSTYHSAIYIGNNQYVAAAKPGTNVAVYDISPYFEPSFAGTVK